MRSLSNVEFELLRDLASHERVRHFDTATAQALRLEGLIYFPCEAPLLISDTDEQRDFKTRFPSLTPAGRVFVTRYGIRQFNDGTAHMMVYGEAFTRTQWDLLRAIRAQKQIWTDYTDDAIAMSLEKRWLVRIPPDAISVKGDPVETRRENFAAIVISETGLACLAECDEEFEQASRKYRNTVLEFRRQRLPIKPEKVKKHSEAMSKYANILKHRMPTVMTLVSPLKRQAILSAIDDIKFGRRETLNVIFSPIADAWNEGIIRAISEPSNDVSLQIRKRLPPMSSRTDITRIQGAVVGLLKDFPSGTKFRSHLELAERFMEEIAELK